MTPQPDATPEWYEVETRPEELRTTFEADLWDLEGHSDTDLELGKPIDRWEGIGWFAASTVELEGPLEDVLKTANLLPVVSARLKSTLEANRIGGVQYLPVTIYDSADHVLATYYLANTLSVIDALDEKRSTLRRRTYRKRDGTVLDYIAWVSRTVFRASAVQGHDIIRLSNYSGPIYVSNKFREVFEQNGFTGISFLPIELTR